jgi:hypothetical protein
LVLKVAQTSGCVLSRISRPSRRISSRAIPIERAAAARTGDGGRDGTKVGLIVPDQSHSLEVTRAECEDNLTAGLTSKQRKKASSVKRAPTFERICLAVPAIALRDGPRPERTPRTDPNLANVGPTFGNGRLIDKDARFFQLAPGGKRVLFSMPGAAP